MSITIVHQPPAIIEIVQQVGAEIAIESPFGASIEITDVGMQGPPGPVGPAAPTYEHVQSSPATTWTINHNLGFRPSVNVFSPGGVEVDAAVVNISTAQTIISFSSPQAGYARLN